MPATDLVAQRCRVVLVRPAIAGNLGATARVMRNFGLHDLRLVAPTADVDDRQARQLSTHGEAILDQARLHDDLLPAIADCVLVLGTSARIGGRFREDNVRSPRDAALLVAQSLQVGAVALVFGPEQTGLSNEEVTLCHYLVTIAANPEYPALNLAQAVAIVLYELSQARDLRPLGQPLGVADHSQQERVFLELEAALVAIGFLRGDNRAALMHALRHLIGHDQPSTMEINLLLGLARQLHWFASDASAGHHAASDVGPLPPQSG